METLTIDYGNFYIECECDVYKGEEECESHSATGGYIGVISVKLGDIDITEMMDLDKLSDILEVQEGILTEYQMSQRKRREAILEAQKVLGIAK